MPLIDLISGIKSENIVIKYISNIFNYFNLPLVLTNVLIVFFILIVLKNIFKLLETYLYANFRRILMFDISSKIFNNLMDVAYNYYHNTKKGDILFTITGTSGQMGHIILAGNRFLMTFFMLIGYLTLLFLISYKLTFLSLGISILILPLVRILLKISHKISKKLTAAQQNFNSFFVETIDGIQIIKAYGREKYVTESFCKRWNRYLKATVNTYVNSSLINTLYGISTVLIVIIIVIIGTKYFDLDFSSMVIFLFVLYRFIPNTHLLVTEINEIIKALPPVQIAIDAMSRKNKPYLPDGNIRINKLNDYIKFETVNFCYNNNVPILRNIDININKGNITAIVGATGSGKSTMMSLLLRFYDVSSGKILIDGINIKKLKKTTWLALIAFVPQDVFLFNISIKENILFGNLNATDEQVIESAKAANAHNFIMKLPNGYDTIIGERGVKLSGGQKQMIALARALVKKPQLLILDEATSSLDNESEQLIQDAINTISKQITIIAIAHRLSTVVSADKIIVIDNGEIVETGKHKELLNLNGHYAKYYNLHLRSMDS